MTTYEKLAEALQDLDLTDAKHYAAEMERENAKLREESAEKTAWINEIFRRLGLPSGDMGALENYILTTRRVNFK